MELRRIFFHKPNPDNKYADYENRIERGRSYLRNDAVVDLKIKGNEIYSRVLGGGYKPYRIRIRIDALSERQRLNIEQQASGKLQDLESLIQGNFPKDLKNLFFQKGGLFPSPNEIHFDCNCPDWADMCKHVAAVMYGIGIRIDTNPTQLFELRGIPIESLLTRVIDDKVSNMLKNVDVKSARIIKDADISSIFGI